MARKSIELYNFDKYQPHMPSPQVERIEGDADEVVLSADGNERSASNGIAGSISLNANGGVWTNTGSLTTCENTTTHVTSTDTTTTGEQTFLTFSRSTMRSVTCKLIVQSGSSYMSQQIVVIHDGTNVNVHADDVVKANPVDTWNTSYDAAFVGDDNVSVRISGVSKNTIVKCVAQYILI